MNETSYREALKADVAAKIKTLASATEAELKTLRIGRYAENRTMLHHYTTSDGVLGIVTNKVIYATSAQFLNDYSEIAYGLAMARDAILDIKKASNHLFEQMFFDIALDKLARADISGRTYIACFCERRDLLSQWRGYGANGGYSLDFHTAEMRPQSPPTSQELVKVVYDPAIQQQVLDSAIRRYRSALREAFQLDKGNFALEWRLDGPKHPAIVEMENLVCQLLSDLAYLALFFKSPTFEEEREWRLLMYRTVNEFDQLKFRSARGLLIPYIEIPLQIAKSSLASITCGPSPHGALAKRSVELLLGKNGLQGVPVLGSEVPLKL